MSSPSLTGYSPQNPRRYLGPNVGLTAIVTRNRQPTGADIKDPNTGKYYSFGTQWLVGESGPGFPPVNGTRGDLWYLSYIESNVGIWVQIQSDISTSGTFSPTVNTSNNNISVVYGGGNLGQYQVIGDWVMVGIQLGFTTSAGTGNLVIQSLPIGSVKNGWLSGYITSPTGLTPQQQVMSFVVGGTQIAIYPENATSGTPLAIPSGTNSFSLQLTGVYQWRL